MDSKIRSRSYTFLEIQSFECDCRLSKSSPSSASVGTRYSWRKVFSLSYARASCSEARSWSTDCTYALASAPGTPSSFPIIAGCSLSPYPNVPPVWKSHQPATECNGPWRTYVFPNSRPPSRTFETAMAANRSTTLGRSDCLAESCDSCFTLCHPRTHAHEGTPSLAELP